MTENKRKKKEAREKKEEKKTKEWNTLFYCYNKVKKVCQLPQS
jgi:hypothetical protein